MTHHGASAVPATHHGFVLLVAEVKVGDHAAKGLEHLVMLGHVRGQYAPAMSAHTWIIRRK